MLLYALTIFLSAFLLFQVQPLIAKIILPWFGGSAAVWSAAMMFFQISLLAGYAYAHVVGKLLKPRMQMMVHGVLLLISCVLLPILPNEMWKPTAVGDPTWRIVMLLAATIGLPYFLLSSTSPLLQVWYVRRTGSQVPYRLFALSNFGSMLALLSFPFVVEPALASRTQAYTWSGLYVVFALLCFYAAWVSKEENPALAVPAAAATEASSVTGIQTAKPTFGDRLMWVSLAACASVLLVSVTNHMSANVAPIPLLWVVPLALYLLSFILSFESDRIYQRWLFVPWAGVALAYMAKSIYEDEGNLHIKWAIPIFSIGLFLCCMLLHGELARRRPATSYLTSYYLMISLGGAVGGVFVALIAPNVFKTFIELSIGLTACAVLAVIALWDMEIEEMTRSMRAALCIVLAVLAVALGWYLNSITGMIPAVIAGVSGVGLAFIFWKDTLWGIRFALAIGVGLLGGKLASLERTDRQGYHLMVRNFYGALRVRDDGVDTEFATRNLLHGTINHGSERLTSGQEYNVGSYYGPKSGIGRSMEEKQSHGPVRYGVVGLGAGVMTGYARKEDYVRVYEINPNVPPITKGEFKFLPHAGQLGADADVLMGDARLTMEAQPPPNYDVLVIDAFSSDAIPIHLLTREAFLLYKKLLKPDGVLAVHISNRYLDLAPVCARGAEAMGRKGHVVYDEGDSFSNSTTWVIIPADDNFMQTDPWASSNISDAVAKDGFRAWTDDYSNIVSILSVN